MTPLRAEIRGDGDGPRIVALDTGIKRSIVAQLRPRAARLELHPCTDDAPTSCSRATPTASSSANGPGDPAALDYVVDTIRDARGASRSSASASATSCSCRAVGLETYKLPFGHRGANHPVKDLRTGRIAITTQNHGFAVRGEAGDAATPSVGFDGRAHPRQPLRRHDRGHPPARRRRRLRAVPPRGRARAARLPATSSTTSSSDGEAAA